MLNNSTSSKSALLIRWGFINVISKFGTEKAWRRYYNPLTKRGQYLCNLQVQSLQRRWGDNPLFYVEVEEVKVPDSQYITG